MDNVQNMGTNDGTPLHTDVGNTDDLDEFDNMNYDLEENADPEPITISNAFGMLNDLEEGELTLPTKNPSKRKRPKEKSTSIPANPPEIKDVCHWLGCF